MKNFRAVAKYLNLAVAAAAATLGIGLLAGPVTPEPAEAAQISDAGHEAQLSIETSYPEANSIEQTPPLKSRPQPPMPLADQGQPAAPRALRSGDRESAVRDLESNLKSLSYDPGTVDETFDQYTRFAVIAFQKVHGLEVDGFAGPAVMSALESPRAPEILEPGGAPSRVEVDLGSQLMTVYQDGSPALITHISTGSNETFCTGDRCRQAVTPIGDFKFQRRISGWRTAELGRLYNPVYFTADGVAVHGATSVPLYPASHGCVRIPMHTADLFPTLVQTGTDIHLAG